MNGDFPNTQCEDKRPLSLEARRNYGSKPVVLHKAISQH